MAAPKNLKIHLTRLNQKIQTKNLFAGVLYLVEGCISWVFLIFYMIRMR
ncbi:hypothetical protein L289_0314 [Acinetobacter gerneri DSM 14967 = CIP 107464 = MTCC 9824]|nr:hypothetical protein L289_0314 [Acinetobacter gerneri DSM 14967 = CIP 107464 = MTCC 9824]